MNGEFDIPFQSGDFRQEVLFLAEKLESQRYWKLRKKAKEDFKSLEKIELYSRHLQKANLFLVLC